MNGEKTEKYTEQHILKELIEISHLYGKDSDFVIAGGGNTSCKNAQHLWIKASGTTLADITKDGFVQMNREGLAVIKSKRYPENSIKREEAIKNDLMKSRTNPGKGLRPSVETSLHDLLSYRFVVHTHPWKINALMCSKNAEEETRSLFDGNALFVPYTDPGYILFKEVMEKIEEYKSSHGKEPQMIFLENHGIFVSADETNDINSLYTYLIETLDRKFETYIKQNPEMNSEMMNTVLKGKIFSQQNPVSKPLFKIFYDILNDLNPGQPLDAVMRTSPLISRFTDSRENASEVKYAFTPDIIVYAKASPLFIPQIDFQKAEQGDPEPLKEAFNEYFTENGYLPKILLAEKKALIALDTSAESAQKTAEVFEDAMKISLFTNVFGGPKFMNKRERAFIENWEVENYRRKMAK